MGEQELVELGWSPFFARAFESLGAGGLVPARVVTAHARHLRVRSEAGERLAEPSGRLRHDAARDPEARPTAGDWVVLQAASGGRSVVQAVLPRRTAFVRRAAGDATVRQVLAANVDTVFLVVGLDRDFNPRRLERALVLAWESGAAPVVLLNKADLCEEAAARQGEAERAAPGVPVRVVSAKEGRGLDALAPWLAAGKTVALIGSSGVGKSTLVNRLLGEERQATRAVREGDQRGRHTTTRRELVRLPEGGMLLDTPGLREIQLWAGGDGLEAVFGDIESLAGGCRFRDCAHLSEPGCGVRAAVASGLLAEERLASYLKLRAEVRSLEIREDPELRRRQTARWRVLHRAQKAHRPRE